MRQMLQKFYSVDGGLAHRGDRKKLKRQAKINGSDMDMSDISQNSLLCGMQQFDRAVQNMEDTILVPSRLMDMSVRDDSDKQRPLPALLQTSEPYDVYRLLRSVRGEVRRGGGVGGAPPADGPAALPRRTSTLSSHSLSSLASEASLAGGAAPGEDSGHESEPADDPCELMQAEFSAHLSGLGKCLAQMTEAASYLSSRYEQQLDSGF